MLTFFVCVLSLHYNINSFKLKSNIIYSVPVGIKVWSWSLAAAASEFLLEMQILRPNPKCTESDALILGPSNLYFKIYFGVIDISSSVRTRLQVRFT